MLDVVRLPGVISGSAVPIGTLFYSRHFPGTSVPGFHMPPLRGWGDPSLEAHEWSHRLWLFGYCDLPRARRPRYCRRDTGSTVSPELSFRRRSGFIGTSFERRLTNKKKTGLVGPASSASSWMRLHHSAARLALRECIYAPQAGHRDRKIWRGKRKPTMCWVQATCHASVCFD